MVFPKTWKTSYSLQVVLSSGLEHAFSIAVLGKHLYWSDWQREKVMRAIKWTGEDIQVMRNLTYLNLLGVLAVYNDTCMLLFCLCLFWLQATLEVNFNSVGVRLISDDICGSGKILKWSYRLSCHFLVQKSRLTFSISFTLFKFYWYPPKIASYMGVLHAGHITLAERLFSFSVKSMYIPLLHVYMYARYKNAM